MSDAGDDERPPEVRLLAAVRNDVRRAVRAVRTAARKRLSEYAD